MDRRCGKCGHYAQRSGYCTWGLDFDAVPVWAEGGAMVWPDQGENCKAFKPQPLPDGSGGGKSE